MKEFAGRSLEQVFAQELAYLTREVLKAVAPD